MSNLSNMDLWNAVEKTNPAHTKKVTFGRAITAIDPYHQIKNATEQFGPAGQGWGWEVRKTEIFETKEVAVLVRVWIKDAGYIEQWGQNGLYIDKDMKKKDTDHMKKATTDGLTKCLSCMGFNADVFLGKFDDNKYVKRMESEFAGPAYNEFEHDQFHSIFLEDNPLKFYCFHKSLSEKAYEDLFKSFKSDKMKSKEKCNQLINKGLGKLSEVCEELDNLAQAQDISASEVIRGLSDNEKRLISKNVDPETLKFLKTLSE